MLITFEEFVEMSERVFIRMYRFGGTNEKHLARYIETCECPERARANFLLKSNYDMLKKYFDGTEEANGFDRLLAL